MSNLKKLLENNKVEIPILQRDYAQGRISQNKVANEFLDSIFSVLNGKKHFLHIDFIYGYKENGKFLLIDGQQRITTLWLLHFYLYKNAGSLEEIKELLKNFSYNTRKSSAKFCKNLLKEDFDINKKPSDAIKAKGGEFEKEENLNNDPTIKAMLHMLDLIFERIKNVKDFKKLIVNLDNITFDLFDMGEFGLGEELYIKMNARGRQLSKYENLKSFIEKDSRISKEFKLLESIDTKWSDYFFDSKDIKNFDKKGNNFLHYATLFFILEEGKEIGNIREIIDKPDQPVNEFYSPLQNIDNIKLLNRVVELCMLFDEFQITETLKIKDSSFFVSRNKETLSYSDICYFFSILFFAKENREIEKINKNALNDYLRVCRHFIENHRLDKPEEHIYQFFKLFKHLSQGHNNIYQFLVKNDSYSFHSNIYHLEVRKAKLILDSRQNGKKWEEILNKTSEHRVLNGWVDFLLDFSDKSFVYEQYNQNGKTLEKPNFEKFKRYTIVTMELLNKDFLDENLTLFQRAFLCIGNFGFYSTNWFYGNLPTDIFRDREALNWLLKGNKNDLKYPYFKRFLDNLLEIEGGNLVDKMQSIIDKIDLTQKEWWEQLLIGEQKIFDFLNEKKEVFQRCRRIRYFGKTSSPVANNLKDIVKVELLPGLRNRTNVRDLLDYGFYCYCSKKKEIRLSSYECKEEQYGEIFEPHFSLNNVKVLCDSIEQKIVFGDKEYKINLEKGNNIFVEFDRILNLINEL
ncbi:DUF262 domain-containing protein [Helicobacter cinaedi]|uniref:Protein of uncharacterized function DUF262 n=1 Tax=Helicobacter cinaedi TaxID=213 RepID=A0A377JQN9_9HELI|nr:DUF262 domain-containing protein [Helicobacter cinaedi]STP09355.1 Protein of uncharacterised function DUF262 [Helicobacter cinaedi]